MSGNRTTNKKTTSGTRKTASRSNNRTTTRKSSSGAKKPIVQKGNGIWDEVRLVGLILLALFLFISNIGLGGSVGSVCSRVLFGVIGIFAYVFPVVMLMLILFSLANPDNLVARIKIVASVVECIVASALAHTFTMGKSSIDTVKEIYHYCAQNHTGGGVIGGFIQVHLQGAFGSLGNFLILFGILIICMVILTEKSFVGGMKKGSKKVYDTAVQDMERRRVHAEEMREMKRARAEELKELRREERKATGVTMNATIEKPNHSGLRELEDTYEEPETVKPAAAPVKEPENILDIVDSIVQGSEAETVSAEPMEARMPEKSRMEHAFTFPVKESAAHRVEQISGGIQEISFEEAPVTSYIKEVEPAAATVPELHTTTQMHTEPVHTPVQPQMHTEKAHVQPQPQAPVQMEIPHTEEGQEPVKEYQFPPTSLLKAPSASKDGSAASTALAETSMLLQQVLKDFGVDAVVADASQGPAVTRFEVQPAHGVKVSKILALADDIKLNLAVPDIRIEAPIPGKAAVGIEVPNKENSAVLLRELFDSKAFKDSRSKITFAVGKDIGGNIMVSDIAKMPHVLIAGATGSGKSVCINTLIMSILYKAKPDEVKLIMIDPKVVELSVYNGIPHLLIPVVTDPKKASGALNWAVQEMMGRYNRFAETNVRNIEGYNSKIESLAELEGEKPEKMPQIVIIVDELADLMMVSPGEVEDAICRLAQLARAAGIHLVIATQRPSVNVITGLIKANMPSRIAFAVTSGVDSRTILDMNGAEKLLGKGDMLFSPAGAPKPMRVQGAFVSDAEVGAVVEFLTSQKDQFAADGNNSIEEQMKQMQSAVDSMSGAAASSGGGSDRDVLFVEAGKFIIDKDKASIGMLQRWFKIGFNRAARIMDQLTDAGVVGEEEGTKPRKVLMSMEEFEAYVDEYV